MSTNTTSTGRKGVEWGGRRGRLFIAGLALAGVCSVAVTETAGAAPTRGGVQPLNVRWG